MSDIDRAELRRLLAEATPGPWEFGDRQLRAKVNPKMFGEGRCAHCGNPDRPLVHTGRGKNPWHVHEGERPWWDHGVYAYRASGSLIVVNDTDEYGYMAGEDARFIVAAINALPGLLDALEKAETAIERVREMHYPADNDPARTPRCEECEGRAGVHPCGCWADEDRQPVCGHCNGQRRGQRVPWPCSTIQALDGAE